jgi:hypothetical protein
MEVIVTWVVMEGYDWKSFRVISNDKFCHLRGQNSLLLLSQCFLGKTVKDKCLLHYLSSSNYIFL